MRVRTCVLAVLTVLVGGCEADFNSRSDTMATDSLRHDVVIDVRLDDVLSDVVSGPEGIIPPDSYKPDIDPNKRSCYTGSSGCTGTPGSAYTCQGICQAGIQKKVGGVWGSCQGQVLPLSLEICGDGKDTNCDGDAKKGCQTLVFLEGKSSGNSVTDSSGNGKHGTITGNVSSQKGGIGGSDYLKFSGNPTTIGKVVIPSKPTVGFTMAFWLRTMNPGGGQRYLVSAYRETPPSYLRLILYPQGLYFNDYASGCVLSSTKVADGKWHQVMIVGDVKECWMYVDGVETQKGVVVSYKKWDFTSVNSLTLGEFIMGGVVPGSRYQGDLDEFQLDGRVWTAAEVKGYYDFLSP